MRKLYLCDSLNRYHIFVVRVFCRFFYALYSTLVRWLLFEFEFQHNPCKVEVEQFEAEPILLMVP